jgi:hypothetical protein
MPKLLFSVVCVLGLGGCASSHIWQHPGLSANEADRQFQIDSAECQALAMQTIALPAAAPQINVTAVASNYPMSPLPAESGGFWKSFDEGAASGDHFAAVRARTNLATACMLRRGWERAKPGQESTAATDAPAPVQPSVASETHSSDDPTAPTSASPTPSQGAVQYDQWAPKNGRAN